MTIRSRTIKDVATEAGVSIATVSDIVGGRGGRYRQETSEKVLAAAGKLGYRPHAGARAMRRNRFSTYGLVISQAPRWESLLIEGVDRAAVARNVGLMLVHVPRDDSELPSLVTRLQVDGLIADWAIPARVSTAIARYQIPTIWVNSDRQGDDSVWPDDVAGGRVATEHLLSLGHRRIVFVGVRQAVHISQVRRLEGYLAAMAAADLDPRIVYLECPNSDMSHPPVSQSPQYFSQRFRHDELWKAFETDGEPTACVIYNCDAAQEVYSSCRRHGRDPSQFAFVACDDQACADEMVPALTTVLVDHVEMGAVAVGMLSERLAGPCGPLPGKVMPVRLIVRESSTPPGPSVA